jgi:hypothetical protein
MAVPSDPARRDDGPTVHGSLRAGMGDGPRRPHYGDVGEGPRGLATARFVLAGETTSWRRAVRAADPLVDRAVRSRLDGYARIDPGDARVHGDLIPSCLTAKLSAGASVVASLAVSIQRVASVDSKETCSAQVGAVEIGIEHCIAEVRVRQAATSATIFMRPPPSLGELALARGRFAVAISSLKRAMTPRSEHETPPRALVTATCWRAPSGMLRPTPARTASAPLLLSGPVRRCGYRAIEHSS